MPPTLVDLKNAVWADWDGNGDLLYASEGCVYRLPDPAMGMKAAKKLIDLTGERFRELEAPEESKQW